MMMGVAFVLERSGIVVDRQTVADQDAAEVFSENVAQELTSAALSNDIEGSSWVVKTHSHQPGPATHQLVSSLCSAGAWRSSVARASYWGFTLAASRSRAWERPPELSCRPKQSRRTAQALRMESPLALLRSAATARARGPSCTPAAPMASDICKGCVERRLCPHWTQVAW